MNPDFITLQQNLQTVHNFLQIKKVKDVPASFQEFLTNLKDTPKLIASKQYLLALHSDKNRGCEEDATQAFQALSSARETLAQYTQANWTFAQIFDHLPNNINPSRAQSHANFTNPNGASRSSASTNNSAGLNHYDKNHYTVKLQQLLKLLDLISGQESLHTAINTIFQQINNHQIKTPQQADEAINNIEEAIINVFKGLTWQAQLPIIKQFKDDDLSKLSELFSQFMAISLIQSPNNNYTKLIDIISIFGNLNALDKGFNLALKFIEDLIVSKQLYVSKNEQVILNFDQQNIGIANAENFKQHITDCYKAQVYNFIEAVLLNPDKYEYANTSVANIAQSVPKHYFENNGSDLYNFVEGLEKFSRKTLQHLSEIAKLDSDTFKALLAKLFRQPELVNHLNIGPRTLLLSKLKMLIDGMQCDISSLTKLLKFDLKLSDKQIQALIELKLSTRNLMITDMYAGNEYNPDRVLLGNVQSSNFFDATPQACDARTKAFDATPQAFAVCKQIKEAQQIQKEQEAVQALKNILGVTMPNMPPQ